MRQMVDQAVLGYEPSFDVRLLLFPEVAHAAPVYDTVEKLERHRAVPISNEHTENYCGLARKLRAHLRNEVHVYLQRSWLEPGGGDREPLPAVGIRARIAAGKRRLQGGVPG